MANGPNLAETQKFYRFLKGKGSCPTSLGFLWPECAGPGGGDNRGGDRQKASAILHTPPRMRRIQKFRAFRRAKVGKVPSEGR